MLFTLLPFDGVQSRRKQGSCWGQNHAALRGPRPQGVLTPPAAGPHSENEEQLPQSPPRALGWGCLGHWSTRARPGLPRRSRGVPGRGLRRGAGGCLCHPECVWGSEGTPAGLSQHHRGSFSTTLLWVRGPWPVSGGRCFEELARPLGGTPLPQLPGPVPSHLPTVLGLPPADRLLTAQPWPQPCLPPAPTGLARSPRAWGLLTSSPAGAGASIQVEARHRADPPLGTSCPHLLPRAGTARQTFSRPRSISHCPQIANGWV